MSSLSKLRKRNNSTNYSDDIYGQYIEDYKLYFNSALNKTDYIDYYNKAIIGKSIILDVSFNNATNGDEKYITTLPNSKLYIGQILSLKFEDDIKYWIITEKEHLAIPSHDKFKMRPCNFILKWMDNGSLCEQPCIVINNTKYTGGTKALVSGVREVDAMVNITISMNENTNKIGYGKRFYTMKNAWQVTLIDDITTKNVLSWTLGKDSINNETDDVELGICDYYEHNYNITLGSSTEQIIENGTYKIIPKVTDEGKEVVSPHVMYKSNNTEIATVDEKGLVTSLKVGTCVITCTIGSSSVDLTINVIAKSVTPSLTYQVNPSNGYLLKLMSSTSLVCNKYSDSVMIPCDVQYLLDSVGTSLLSSKKIDVQYKETKDASGNSLGMNVVWIKNLNCTTLTSFTITISDKLDGHIITTQSIQLKGV